MIPTYQNTSKFGTAGEPTQTMYYKMLSDYNDRHAFMDILKDMDVEYWDKSGDKADRHVRIKVISPEYRDMIIERVNALPNTTLPEFDKEIFNTNTLDKLKTDIIYDDMHVIILGDALFSVRNLIFDQKNDNETFKYGTYFERKGYKIERELFDEEAVLHNLKVYGYKPQIYEGSE